MTEKYSQILLVDDAFVHRIVNLVPREPFGVEWASGRGGLTDELVHEWNYLLGMEIDPEFCRSIRKKFSKSELGLIRTDILEYPLPEWNTPYPLVGNLPYHITGPLAMKILRSGQRIRSFTGLLQWEVAQRLEAKPGDSDYGSFSLLFRMMGTIEVHDRVPCSAFHPEPDVDSAIVHFELDDDYGDFEAARSLARVCFRHPRKTLLNNLANESGDKGFWKDQLEKLNWDTRRRPQTLEPNEFEELLEVWE